MLNVFGGNLNKLWCGGAPLNPDAAKFFKTIGIGVLKGYGLTETSPLLCSDRLDKFNAKSVGYAIDSVEVKINNPDENGVGEVIAKGGNIMLGYYKDVESTKKVIKDGWFYTGDSGLIDNNGWLYILGRLKNIIVLKNGKKVNPEEIEVKINEIDYVKECLVSGIASKNRDDVEISAKIVPDYDYLKSQGIDKEDSSKIYELIKKEIQRINSTSLSYKRISSFTIKESEFEKTTKKSIKRYKEEQKC